MAQEPITKPHEVLLIYNNIARRKGYKTIPIDTQLVDPKAAGVTKTQARALSLIKATDMLVQINKAPHAQARRGKVVEVYESANDNSGGFWQRLLAALFKR